MTVEYANYDGACILADGTGCASSDTSWFWQDHSILELELKIHYSQTRTANRHTLHARERIWGGGGEIEYLECHIEGHSKGHEHCRPVKNHQFLLLSVNNFCKINALTLTNQEEIQLECR